MYRRYRRNADMDISALERAWQTGDTMVFPALVAAYVRADRLNLSFLVSYPEAFQYLPASWQFSLWQMTCPGTNSNWKPNMRSNCFICARGGDHICPGAEGCLCCDRAGTDTCSVCRVEEHDSCPLLPGCDCCQATVEQMNEEDEEDEENDEEADYDCSNCGNDLYASGQGEDWDILTEHSALITNARNTGGDEGHAMCLNCLSESGLDLEQAVQEDLSEEFCLKCGYSLDECECEDEDE